MSGVSVLIGCAFLYIFLQLVQDSGCTLPTVITVYELKGDAEFQETPFVVES